MQTIRKTSIYLLLLCGMFTLQACDNNDGPLEEIGEDIDEAADDVGDAVEEACENVTDSNCD